MSRLRPLLPTTIALALASIGTCLSAAPIPAAINGSFEEWTKDGPVGWQLNNHPDLAGAWEQSESARTGQRAVSLRAGAKGQCHVYQWHFAVSPQTIFRATAWVKGEGQGSLPLYTYDAKQVFNGGWPGVQVALGKDYQPVNFCYVPDRPEVAFVALVLVCSGQGAYAFFDDVTTESLSIEELNRASGYVADLAGEVKAGQWSAPAGGSVAPADGPFAAPAAQSAVHLPGFRPASAEPQPGGRRDDRPSTQRVARHAASTEGAHLPVRLSLSHVSRVT